ncbi:hypothetical protein SB759_39465, partial [Pseudomonas sp. SIMBA_059]
LSIEDRVSRTQYQFSLSSPDADLLAQWSSKLVQALQQRPELADVASDLHAIRHDIHAHPELGFEESRTSALVARLLEAWG